MNASQSANSVKVILVLCMLYVWIRNAEFSLNDVEQRGHITILL